MTTETTITALRPIRAYDGPMWFVEPTEPIAEHDMDGEIAEVTAAGYQVVDTAVTDWGYDAIITSNDAGWPIFYLAAFA